MKQKKTRSKRTNLTLLRKSNTRYPDSPDEAGLESVKNTHPKRDYWITLACPEFTSVCPITSQPDYGHITIHYVPDKLCLESKSLKLYLFSFRNHGAFHEEVVNRILDDILKAVKPRKAVVKGVFNPRGGISISSVSAAVVVSLDVVDPAHLYDQLAAGSAPPNQNR